MVSHSDCKLGCSPKQRGKHMACCPCQDYSVIHACCLCWPVASSISFANTFGVLITVVVYDLVVVRLSHKFNRPIKMTTR